MEPNEYARYTAVRDAMEARCFNQAAENLFIRWRDDYSPEDRVEICKKWGVK